MKEIYALLVLAMLILTGCGNVREDITGNVVAEEVEEEVPDTTPPSVDERRLRISPTDSEMVKITKPGHDKEPKVTITGEDEEEEDNPCLTKEQIRKIEGEMVSANNRVLLPDAFLKLEQNEKYTIGMGVMNPYPKAKNFSLRLVKMIAEEKIGNSHIEVRRDLRVDSWILNRDELKNFQVERNQLGIVPIEIQAGPTIKTDREAKTGDRVTYDFEIWLLDGKGKGLDLYSIKTIVIRVI